MPLPLTEGMGKDPRIKDIAAKGNRPGAYTLLPSLGTDGGLSRTGP